jgi:hypothetical protein
MKDLQEIINKKAEKRATNEIAKLCQAFHNNTDLLNILNEYNLTFNLKNTKGENTLINDNFRTLFFNTSQKLPRQLIKDLTKVYIPIESKNFIDKVATLSEEIEELKTYK